MRHPHRSHALSYLLKTTQRWREDRIINVLQLIEHTAMPPLPPLQVKVKHDLSIDVGTRKPIRLNFN